MVDDLPEMRFARVSDLYQWADELATRADVRCSLGVSRSGGGKHRASDYKDLALTIIGVAASLPDAFKRDMFRQVAGFGSEEARASLASQVADIITKYSPVAAAKPRGKLCRLCAVAILHARAEIGNSKNRPTLNWYAFVLGIRRQSLNDGGWRGIIREAEDAVMTVYRGGEAAFKSALEERGLWGGTEIPGIPTSPDQAKTA